MQTGILIGSLVLVVVAMMFFKKRNFNRQTLDEVAGDPTIPDRPIGFGYKCMWFAVRTENRERIAEILQLKNLTDCNWRSGISRAYNNAVFITPPIDGWTLACGWGLYGDIQEMKKKLVSLSQEFGEAQFFSTHRVTEYHNWMKAVDGQMQRVYIYSGESGENIAVEGEPIDFEKTLNLANTFSEEAADERYDEREDITWPDEELLMKVAGNWSVDPTRLDERQDLEPQLGLSGYR